MSLEGFCNCVRHTGLPVSVEGLRRMRLLWLHGCCLQVCLACRSLTP